MDMTTLGTNIKNAIIAKLNALLPSQSGNSGKVLGTNGSSLSWVDAGSGGGGTESFYTQTANSLAFDANNGRLQKVSITTAGTYAISLANMVAGQEYVIAINCSALATITLPSAHNTETDTFTISSSSSRIVSVINDGTNTYWLYSRVLA